MWNYAPVGCLENTFAGDDRSGTVDVNLNLAKAVELALNDGCDMATDKQIGPRTGDPRMFNLFDQFFAAFKMQLQHLLEWIIRVNDLADAGRALGAGAVRERARRRLPRIRQGCECRRRALRRRADAASRFSVRGAAALPSRWLEHYAE